MIIFTILYKNQTIRDYKTSMYNAPEFKRLKLMIYILIKSN